ncbi:hypothetical protein [Chitinophaga flava]|uniref:MoxR-vWA-beta-propeller ternary system domain-containing protein n=1 Tax=Chitinophaga flava TaxID=2259036 RepID=A0A365Y0L8_9BACT|nr:hypothetical protein [Chitinophaga flava]RBL92137.1 hypothetical protein DF182_05950 [Chitinophaga flava]
MKITLGLQYTSVPAIAEAAFIYGDTAGIWLQEIDRWQMPMEILTALPVPQPHSAEIAGLLVLFNHAVPPFPERLQHPYQLLGHKLFIPANASLTPVMEAAELQQLLIWDWQVFHPSIGFIGYDKEQLLPLTSLLTFPAPSTNSWEQARIGAFTAPPLQKIMVSDTTPEIIFGEAPQQVGNTPLSDIFPSQGPDAPDTGKSIFNKLLSFLSGNKNTPAGPSNLEQRRQQELERLNALFDTDTDEALKYALPLDSPYLSRKSADQPSSSLQRRDTNFSLGKLGGTGTTDYWNMGNYHETLREKYVKAALAALNARDYRKAAYVYAHLLGDYHMAAHALEQGHYYREAATLYLEHLNNSSAAAGAFEKGGLLQEAIEIYITLEQFEKAGDLYVRLEQPEKADQQYQQAIALLLDNKNYSGAAQLALEKLGEPEQAKQYLLTGWTTSGWMSGSTHTGLLEQYFQLSADNLREALENVYREHTPAARETDFLTVLKDVTTVHSDSDIRNFGIDLAYEIISKKIQAKEPEQLHLLKHFLPGDKLLAEDINRHTSENKIVPKQLKAEKILSFATDVRWLGGLQLPDQLLFLGFGEKGLYLLDFDMADNWYYKLWEGRITTPPDITMIYQRDGGEYIYLLGQTDFPIKEKSSTHRNNTGNSFTIQKPDWLPTSGLVALLIQKNLTITVCINNGVLSLMRYMQTDNFPLCGNHICKLDDVPISSVQYNGRVQQLEYNTYYYFYLGTKIFTVAIDGTSTATHDLGAEILHMSTLHILTTVKLAVATTKGLVMVFLSGKKMLWKSDYLTDKITRKTVLTWLPDERLVAGIGKLVIVYAKPGGNRVNRIARFTTAASVCAITKMPNPQQISILEENGKFGIYDLPN